MVDKSEISSSAEKSEKIHFVVRSEAKKFDTAEQMKTAVEESGSFNLQLIEKLTLGGNSYGFDACEWLAQQLAAQDTPHLKAIDFGNIFVSRLRAEIPKSLNVMALALLAKQLVELDLSDNAFGPDGIKAFECLLKDDKALKVLKVTNCGLGPEGGEMIAAALEANDGLTLTTFHAGRDRLENKGIIALAGVFAKIKSLEEVHVPQNGIKDEGMSKLLLGLTSCKDLSILRVNDNWLKTASTEKLVELIFSTTKLRELDISDGNMGTANVVGTLRALVQSKNLITKFSCNYNDVEGNQFAEECLRILHGFTSLKEIDFVGNVQSAKLQKEWLSKFEGRSLKLVEDDTECCDDEDDEDEEEDDEDTNEQCQSKLDMLISKFEQLQLAD